MKRSFSILGATVALAGVSHASYILENFNSYTANADLEGLGWSATPSGSGIAVAWDSAWDDNNPATARTGTIGGFDISPTTSVTLSKTANVVFDGPTALPTFVQFEVGLDYFGVATGVLDSYSFLVSSSLGDGNLLTIDLTPNIGGTTYDLSFSSSLLSGSLPTIPGALTDTGTWTGSNVTQFRLETAWNVMLNQVDYTLTNAGAPISSGFVTGAVASDEITGFSVTLTTDNDGDEYVAFDNIYVVPEPSSALLGLLGAAFAFTRRRRA